MMGNETSNARDSLDLNVLSYRFDRLEDLCSKLDTLIRRPDCDKIECQETLIKLRDELMLVGMALESDGTRAIIADFNISSRELYVLIFAGTDRLLEKAFKNNKESIMELTNKVRTSISLWRTRIIGPHEASTASGAVTAQPTPEPKNGSPVSEAKLPLGKDLVFTHSQLGRVKIKYISLNDAIRIQEFLQETNSRRFAVSVVHHQLIQPKLGLDEIGAWPDDVLIEVCLKLLENEPTIRSHFDRRTEHSFFENFHEAFVAYQKEQTERLGAVANAMQSQMSGAIERVAASLNTLGFRAAMQALATYNFRGLSANMQAIQSMSRFILPPIVLPAVRPSWLDPPLRQPTEYRTSHLADEVTKEAIEVLLDDVDVELEQKRQGAWQTFHGTSQDGLSQAMHSMREVLRQLLDMLAPEEEVPRASWYDKPPKAKSLVTRKMRVRFALAGTSSTVSKSTLELVDSLADSVDKTYAKISGEAHRKGEAPRAQVEAYLRLCEAIILILLVNRGV